MAPNARSDRYDPLPGVTEIPGWLYRKLSARGRRVTQIAGVLLVVALAAGIVFGLPAITTTKEERAAAEQRAVAKHRAEEIARLQAELRLARGSGTPAHGLTGEAALTARNTLAGELAAAVKTDADARAKTGEFTHSISRVECERFPRAANSVDPADDLAGRTGRYSCLAITADAPRTATNQASSIGYPYRALVHFGSGRFAYCKVSGRPGEGSLVGQFRLHVPAACGGAA